MAMKIPYEAGKVPDNVANQTLPIREPYQDKLSRALEERKVTRKPTYVSVSRIGSPDFDFEKYLSRQRYRWQ